MKKVLWIGIVDTTEATSYIINEIGSNWPIKLY